MFTFTNIIIIFILFLSLVLSPKDKPCFEVLGSLLPLFFFVNVISSTFAFFLLLLFALISLWAFCNRVECLVGQCYFVLLYLCHCVIGLALPLPPKPNTNIWPIYRSVCRISDYRLSGLGTCERREREQANEFLI